MTSAKSSREKEAFGLSVKIRSINSARVNTGPVLAPMGLQKVIIMCGCQQAAPADS